MSSLDPADRPGEVHFSFEWYERFLEWLLDHGYTSVAFGGDKCSGAVILRHDVDISPRKALSIGRLESELGVSSTYFFLVTSPLYNPLDGANRAIIQELVDLGHRVGLHFSTHQYWEAEPSPNALSHRVRREQAVLEAVSSQIERTISFHCPPTWVLNRSFQNLESTYEPSVFSEIEYLADSGQRWRGRHLFQDSLPESLQILTHPGLWGSDDGNYIQRVMTETKITLDRAARSVRGELLENRFKSLDYPPVER